MKLVVYDVPGNESAVLVDGWVSASEHRTIFDGALLSSGVYFVRLAAGDNYSVRKMILLK
ncbi:MAG: T9SS type A sorting domain-containing protein [FCB group bacterium]|nr:T9SS type A sorting domain-containing protein [FCB group bacterium]